MSQYDSYPPSEPPLSGQVGSSTENEPEADFVPLSNLCSICQQIFEGKWVEKESWELENSATARGIIDLDDTSGETLERADSSSADTTSSFEEHWYESPDWLKLVGGTSDTISSFELNAKLLYSPPHHHITELETSALNGCALCEVLANSIRDKRDELSESTKDNISRLSGIAIVRPSQWACDVEDSLVLQITYFVDGKVEKQAYSCSVDVLLLPYQSCSPHAKVKPLEPKLGHEPPPLRSLTSIESWLSECSENHELCQQRLQRSSETLKKRMLPTRLLLIESTQGNPKVSLRETKNLDVNTRYATLSHCWGRSPIIKLLTEVHEQFVEGIGFDLLPKTFQDAVIFTSALGLQYLWIDSLCIIQNSPNDWTREASLMCSVYSNSWVNFAATSSLDGSGGLFHSENALIQPCVIKATWTGHQAGTYLCIDPSAWDNRVQNGPLNKRGWVLQERILAPRTIHCAYDQLWWSCAYKQPCCNEIFPDGVPEQAQLNGIADPLTAISQSIQGMTTCNEYWLSIVGNYSQRDLTYSSDKLIALSGVAEAVMNILGVSKDSYVAGLWRLDLSTDLLWRMMGTGVRSEIYRAPSWSWASVDGGVYFHFSDVREKARGNKVITLEEAQVTTSHDPLGPVQNGHITITGPLLIMKLLNPDVGSSGNFYFDELHIGNTIYKSGSGFEEVLDHEPLYLEWPQSGKDIYFACIMSTAEVEIDEEYMSEGLILERTGDQPGEYRRIGWLRIFHALCRDSFFIDAAGDHSLKPEDFLQRNASHIFVYTVV